MLSLVVLLPRELVIVADGKKKKLLVDDSLLAAHELEKSKEIICESRGPQMIHFSSGEQLRRSHLLIKW